MGAGHRLVAHMEDLPLSTLAAQQGLQVQRVGRRVGMGNADAGLPLLGLADITNIKDELCITVFCIVHGIIIGGTDNEGTGRT